MDFNLILCAVDFSETSDRAFDYSVELARKLGAKIRVIHVFQISATALPGGLLVAPIDYENMLQEQLQDRLDTYIENKKVKDVEITTDICEGIPYLEITQAATDVHADMIVVGTHGRTGLPHMLMGSVAERVVRTADVPVVSVRWA